MEKLTIKAGNVFKSYNGDKMTGWEIVTCGKVQREKLKCFHQAWVDR